MTTYNLIRVADGAELAQEACQRIAFELGLALAERERALLSLAGGETPKATYRLLGKQHLPWDRVDVLLGDERWVSASDEASNARMLAQSLLASPPGSAARFHPVATELESPEASVRAYTATLVSLSDQSPPRFDLIVLGLGDDGHTASLFPGTPAPLVRDRWVTLGEGKGLPRITLTAPVLCAARKVLFLVGGASKRQALQRLLDPSEPADRTPARLVQPQAEVLILADQDAAAGLP